MGDRRPGDALVRHVRGLPAVWQRLPLVKRFMLAASAVVAVGMLVIGAWVEATIRESVVNHTAAATALYMDRFIQPHVQELEAGSELSAQSRAALARLLANSEVAPHLVSAKIWRAPGTVVFSNHAELTGQEFPANDELSVAWAGGIRASFDLEEKDENAIERGLSFPVLEIYAPVRSLRTSKVIAVAEFYQRADALAAALARARLHSWLLVGSLAAIMLAVLYGIVRRGSVTIEEQHERLESKVAQLSAALAMNEELRERVDQAHRRTAEIDEMLLRRVGAELHDGTAQLLSLALMRLDSLRPRLVALPGRRPGYAPGSGDDLDDIDMIEGVLRDAMREVRNLSAGLSVPEVDRVPLAQVLQLAADLHERRTGSQVVSEIEDLPADLSASLKACLYRFAQEGLNNAFRHAGAKGQALRASCIDGQLRVEVCDRGPGMPREALSLGPGKLGLAGMRNRIESLGGRFNVVSGPEGGTQVAARFEIGGQAIGYG